jgi:hypothetical protein
VAACARGIERLKTQTAARAARYFSVNESLPSESLALIRSFLIDLFLRRAPNRAFRAKYFCVVHEGDRGEKNQRQKTKQALEKIHRIVASRITTAA